MNSKVLFVCGSILRSRWFPGAALLLLILSSKFALICAFGSVTPYWDQWDGEADLLYRRYLDHTLTFTQLLATHNEHRIFVTRLFSLLLLEMAGYWDTILQMLADALVQGLVFISLVSVCLGTLPRRFWMLGASALAVIIMIPFGWENSLSGFQSQFYFMMLFTILGLGMLVPAPAWTPRWLAGIAFGILAFLNMASGMLIFAAATIVHGMQILLGKRSGWRETASLFALIAVVVALSRFVPDIEGHHILRAHSFEIFLTGLLTTASWPLDAGWISVLILYGPSLWLLVRILRNRPHISEVGWVLIAFAVWVLMQCASAAYSRAQWPLASRYQDLFLVGPFVNLAILLNYSDELRSILVRIGASVWIAVVLCAFVLASTGLQHDINERAAWTAAHTANVAAFYRTGDASALLSKSGPVELPYPIPSRLVAFLNVPEIRRILPPDLVPENQNAGRVSLVLTSPAWTSAVQSAKGFMLEAPLLLAGVGVAVLAAVAIFALGDQVRSRNIPDENIF